MKKYVFAYPIRNLVIESVVGGCLKFGRVEFVSRTNLEENLGEYGIEQSYKSIFRDGLMFCPGDEIRREEAFALVHANWDGQRETFHEIEAVQFAEKVLAASQVSYMRRHQYSGFGKDFKQGTHITWEYRFEKGGDGSPYSWHRIFPLEQFRIDELWKMRCDDGFFFPVLELLNKNRQSEWEKDILRAVYHIGRSVLATSISDAFLHNFIALDTLLLRSTEKQSQALFDRIDSLLGWFLDGDKLRPLVDELYKKRCGLFHEGAYSEIASIDLINSDALVYNIISNIMGLGKEIRSKQDLVDYGNRIKAYHTLGHKPRWSKKLVFHEKNIDADDIAKVELHYRYHMA